MGGFFGFGVIPGGTVRGSVLGGGGYFGPVFIPKRAGHVWSSVATGFENTGFFQSIIFTGTLWVVGVSGHAGVAASVLTSPTGLAGSWTRNVLPPGSFNRVLSSLAFGAGEYVAACNVGGGHARLFSSADTLTWTLTEDLAPNGTFLTVGFANGVFIALDQSGVTAQYLTSPDGIVWTLQATFVPDLWSGQIIFDGTQFVTGAVVAGVNKIVSSLDGINWTQHAITLPNLPLGMGFDGAGYTIGNDTTDAGVHGATLATLATAISLNDGGLPTNSIATGGGTWVAVNDNGTDPAAVSSSNGSVWTPDTTSVGGVSMGNVAFGQGKFIACGTGPGANQGALMTRAA